MNLVIKNETNPSSIFLILSSGCGSYVSKVNHSGRPVVLFAGSSSIELWPDLEKTFSEFEVLKNGHGGSDYSYLLDNFDSIFSNRPYDAIVLYSGDNDLAEGQSPAAISVMVAKLLTRIHSLSPTTLQFVISVKPSPVRQELIGNVKTTNDLLRKVVISQPHSYFVDTYTSMLDSKQNLRPEIYLSDQLHLNSSGYQIWIGFLKPLLDSKLLTE